MSEWTRSSLAEIAELRFGKTPSRSEARFWNPSGGYPWATIADMRTDPVLETAETVSEAGLPFAGRSVSAGSIMMSFKLTVGRVARAGTELLTNEAIVSVHGLEGKVDDGWLYHALPEIARGGVTDAAVKGSTLNKAKLEKLKLRLPPLEEQRRIAEVLDTIDETIQATEGVIAKYERVMEGVLQGACLGFPRAEEPTLAIRDFCSLSAGLTPSRGISAYYDGAIPWVKSGEVAGSAILTTEETVSAKAVNDLGLRIVRSGTPLIAMYGATAGEVGWLEIDAATNQAVLAVQPEVDRAHRRWLYWALRLGSGRMLASIQGSGQPNLSKQIIGATKMSLPGLHEQLMEVERIDSAQASIEAQRAMATKLRRTRTGLAADLLSGRVRTVAA